MPRPAADPHRRADRPDRARRAGGSCRTRRSTRRAGATSSGGEPRRTRSPGRRWRSSDLGPLDAVLLTHDHHADNLDVPGRALLADVPIVITTVAGAARLGGTAIGLEPVGDDACWSRRRRTTTDVDVVATPCRHGPPLSHPIVGDVIGFGLVRRASAMTALVDLGRHRAVRRGPRGRRPPARRRRAAPPRWGALPDHRPAALHDDDRRRHRAVPLDQAAVAIPVHYEGWSHFRQGRDAIEQRADRQRARRHPGDVPLPRDGRHRTEV